MYSRLGVGLSYFSASRWAKGSALTCLFLLKMDTCHQDLEYCRPDRAAQIFLHSSLIRTDYRVIACTDPCRAGGWRQTCPNSPARAVDKSVSTIYSARPRHSLSTCHCPGGEIGRHASFRC